MKLLLLKTLQAGTWLELIKLTLITITHNQVYQSDRPVFLTLHTANSVCNCLIFALTFLKLIWWLIIYLVYILFLFVCIIQYGFHVIKCNIRQSLCLVFPVQEGRGRDRSALNLDSLNLLFIINKHRTERDELYNSSLYDFVDSEWNDMTIV